LFTPAERAALRYTEEMTLSSVDVPDEVFDELKRHFNTEQIVDLTATIALENMRARFNRALQVEADGLCMLPAHHPALSPDSLG
jgi:alkylhydroperoxidase family enzyme